MPFPAVRWRQSWALSSIASPPVSSTRLPSARWPSMDTETLSVQVVFALPSDVWRADLQMHPSATVYQDLLASGSAQQFPDRLISAPRAWRQDIECATDTVAAQVDRV